MSEEKKKEFYWACAGKPVRDAEGKVVRRPADTEEVIAILDQVKPQQLLELLMWENPGWGSRTGLDLCLERKYEECISTIVKHVLDTKYVETLTSVFPYAAFVKSTDLVSGILQIVPITRELLKAQTNYTKQTVLDLCVVNNNVEGIRTITEHIIKRESDPDFMDLLSTVFPYTASVKSTNLVSGILQIVPNTRKLLQAQTNDTKQTVLHVACGSGNNKAVEALLSKLEEYIISKDELSRCDNTGRTVLHAACSSGNKAAVELLLPQLKTYHILQEELLRYDETGMTPLCLARAKKQNDTEEAMLQWIKENMKEDPDILEEVKKW